MADNKLITIAIHTFARAQQLRNILECEGIDVTLQNVNLTNPGVSAGVRIRIAEADLPLALRVIENIEIFSPDALRESADCRKPQLLVPVDFSDNSLRACVIASRIASAHHASLHILHTFLDPSFASSATMQLNDTLTFDQTLDLAESIEDSRIATSNAEAEMKRFVERLREKIKIGSADAVPFTTEVTEGLPEEVIDSWAAANSPLLIVMGTRGADATSRDLVGSVTAEVLDSCRTMVLTVPEALKSKPLSEVHNLIYFATAGQEDILALDAIYRIFPEMQLDITLVQLPSRKIAPSPEAAARLLDYCKTNYPAYTFRTSPLSLTNPVSDLEQLAACHKIDLIAVASRKRNIFARLFSPSLAHRLLFHAYIPLLSIPVKS